MKTFGINGFGRIGRTAFRVWWQKHADELDLKVINTSGSMELAEWVHLLKYDSNYGVLNQQISYQKQQSKKDVTDENPVLGTLTIGPKQITVTAQKDPAKIPWGKYGVETVVESTGIFTSAEKAQAHLTAGAKKVIISAPPQGGGVQTLVLGVNQNEGETKTAPNPVQNPAASLAVAPTPDKLDLKSFLERIRSKQLGKSTPSPVASPSGTSIISNASCTTNCVAPIAQIMHHRFGVKKAMLTTIHSYTDDQNLHDNSHKDLRRARAAAMNIVPTTTGAAISATEVVPELKGLFDGLAMRVPTPVGSLSDMVFLVGRSVTKEEVNQAFIEASQEARWAGILAVTDEPIVSSDIKGRSESSIVDLSLTQVVDGDLVKVISWYDNEWGYCNRLVEQVATI
jgi:glyceraldehyde 3-phosphate dehydrogenase